MKSIDILEKYFGYKTFRRGQDDIIDSILRGENVVAVLPTGAGKSLCYQVPALMSENFSIVVSPLIALMKDQVDSLNRKEKIAAFINSTMSYSEADEVLQRTGYGEIKILYCAPERLNNIQFAEKIRKLNPAYIFIDEAHCISEWGHNFRPSYARIKDFIDYTGLKKISAFTATATPEVIEDIKTNLGLKGPRLFVKGFERENLFLNVLVTKKKNQKCLELILSLKTPAIIYTSSRKKTEEIAEFLNMNRIQCSYYHAGLPPQERKKIQEDFLNDKTPVIAATNAFGMGIDKKDIRLVIHYNTPGSIENYYQEIGRGGRDGHSSQAFLLHDDSDIDIQNYFISSSHPDKEFIQKIYNGICDFGRVAAGNISEKEIPLDEGFLSAHTKKEVNKGLLYSAVKILEDAGYLKLISEYDRKDHLRICWDKNRLKDFIRKSSNNLLKETLLILLREYGGEIFVKKTPVLQAHLEEKYGLSRSEIDESLIILNNLGIIEYDKALEKASVRMQVPRVEEQRLILDYKKINKSFLSAQDKLNRVLDFVYTAECRFKFILNYFGGDVSGYRCGKCDNCTQSRYLSDETFEYLSEIISNTLKENDGMLTESVLIKIIMGEGRRDRYSRISTYGSCRNYSKDDLKTVIRQMVLKKSLMKNPGSRVLHQAEEKDSRPEPSSPEYEKELLLFNLLRDARTKAAKKFLQTPYLICSNETLKNIASVKPNDKLEFLSVPGTTVRMFNKLGSEFIEIIKQYSAGQNDGNKNKAPGRTMPENITETYRLLLKKYPLQDIAQLRQLSEAVISMQIETIIEYEPATEIAYLFEGDILAEIFGEIEKGYTHLQELKKRLSKEITYPLLRIAVAKYKFTLKSSYISKFQHGL